MGRVGRDRDRQTEKGGGEGEEGGETHSQYGPTTPPGSEGSSQIAPPLSASRLGWTSLLAY